MLGSRPCTLPCDNRAYVPLCVLADVRSPAQPVGKEGNYIAISVYKEPLHISDLAQLFCGLLSVRALVQSRTRVKAAISPNADFFPVEGSSFPANEFQRVGTLPWPMGHHQTCRMLLH